MRNEALIEPLKNLSAKVSLLLLNVINSREVHHQTHIQPGSPVVIEMQIPAMLG